MIKEEEIIGMAGILGKYDAQIQNLLERVEKTEKTLYTMSEVAARLKREREGRS